MDFNSAFANNFYLTREYAEFCAQVTNMRLLKRDIDGQQVNSINSKNISISNYSFAEMEQFRKANISFVSVLPDVNTQENSPSFFEYTILYKQTYAEAVSKYKTSFTHGLREGKKYQHKVRIVQKPDELLLRRIYAIYLDQMERKNSFKFPFSYFQTFHQVPHSLLFLIETGADIIAYFSCFEFEDNLYTSIGGGNPKFFSLKCSNKLYDEVIKYAGQKGLNIHAGMGEYGSGYQLFKKNTGAEVYKTVRHPNDEIIAGLFSKIQDNKLVGTGLSLISKAFPHYLPYLLMPFT